MASLVAGLVAEQQMETELRFFKTKRDDKAGKNDKTENEIEDSTANLLCHNRLTVVTQRTR